MVALCHGLVPIILSRLSWSRNFCSGLGLPGSPWKEASAIASILPSISPICSLARSTEPLAPLGNRAQSQDIGQVDEEKTLTGDATFFDICFAEVRCDLADGESPGPALLDFCHSIRHSHPLLVGS